MDNCSNHNLGAMHGVINDVFPVNQLPGLTVVGTDSAQVRQIGQASYPVQKAVGESFCCPRLVAANPFHDLRQILKRSRVPTDLFARTGRHDRRLGRRVILRMRARASSCDTVGPSARAVSSDLTTAP
jgi:hypothetical protein